MSTPLERSLTTTHRFAFTPLFRIAALPFGVTPATSHVELVGSHLVVAFGPWKVSTPIANITHAEVTGPYAWPKVIGPAHLTFGDRGLTFATNPTSGAYLELAAPIAGIEPIGWLRHPNLTVTVEDPQQLVTDIRAAQSDRPEVERNERAVLEGRTAAELRTLARELGMRGVSSAKKADLIERILADDQSAGAAMKLELVGHDDATVRTT